MDHISKDQKALESPHSDLASLRRFWAQPTGIESTMQLVQALRKEITKTEAINIASKQQPKRGNYPHGSFQSSTTVAESFFSTDEKETRETILTTEQMPFLYNTLLQTLLLMAQQSPTVLESEDEEPVDGMDLDADAKEPGKKGDSNALPVIETEEWNSIVEDCYTQFCTGQARKEAKARDCSRLHNTLVMLHNFSTVVEAKRSMRDGDVGRLMIIWSKWSLMTQALPGITNYSNYLP
ncbi:hypothetical protein PCASD_04831 [Puccinia coronata f. sp. avenae]|uniref:DUF6589 domain-containing protein n=1 Tax=Puccinia coronata f. sp. avenae TaxID=200324 RepID=A0A2N5V256_9BASI|nr:hypothetical protein PCASD_04831 [Puccinia coronata f. sp. avenae]